MILVNFKFCDGKQFITTISLKFISEVFAC